MFQDYQNILTFFSAALMSRCFADKRVPISLRTTLALLSVPVLISKLPKKRDSTLIVIFFFLVSRNKNHFHKLIAHLHQNDQPTVAAQGLCQQFDSFTSYVVALKTETRQKLALEKLIAH